MKYWDVIVFLRILEIHILLRHVRLFCLIIWQLLHSHPSSFPQQETVCSALLGHSFQTLSPNSLLSIVQWGGGGILNTYLGGRPQNWLIPSPHGLGTDNWELVKGVGSRLMLINVLTEISLAAARAKSGFSTVGIRAKSWKLIKAWQHEVARRISLKSRERSCVCRLPERRKPMKSGVFRILSCHKNDRQSISKRSRIGISTGICRVHGWQDSGCVRLKRTWGGSCFLTCCLHLVPGAQDLCLWPVKESIFKPHWL